MLQKQSTPASGAGPGDWLPASAMPEFGELVEKLLLKGRRQWRVVALSVAVAVGLGFAYLLTAVPLFTARVDILLQDSSSKLLNDFTEKERPADSGVLQTQIELLQSEKIAGRVVDALDLSHDAQFLAATSTPLQRLREGLASLGDVTGWFKEAEAEDDPAALRAAAIRKLLANLDVSVIDVSYVVSVNYTSPFAEQAGTIAKAYGDAYLADRLEAKYAATRSASDWLLKRIEELRQKALQSDLKVQRFRADNNLIATAGVLVTDRNLSQLNTSLVDARAETSRAKAQLDRIRDIIDSGSTDALVTDALNSGLINKLRGEYLQRRKRLGEIVDQLGENHSSVTRIRAEMEQFRKQIFQELGRIAESYQSDYDVAVANERAVEAEVEAATGVTAAGNEVMVQLRELEREAETYRTLYETFLQRYQEAVQQETFPATGARILNEARVPQGPSHPRRSLVLALSILLGGAAGVGIGALREFRERFVRTADDVRQDLGLEFLGVAPLVTSSDVPLSEEELASSAHPRFLQKISSASNISIDHPLSQFSETMRSTRLAADMALGRTRHRTIGIVSILPGEGKSTISINFAEMLASLGSRTLLIDADLRRPGLTWSVARHAGAGLLEAVRERRPLSDLVLRSRQTSLDVLPAVVRSPIAHTSSILGSPGMSALLEEARADYDTVVIDLPPIAPVVDARALAREIDAFILVVEWGKTARRAVRSVLQAEPQILERCLGVVLNKVDRDRMKLYSDHGSSEYYYSSYSGYYDHRSAA